MEKHSIEKHYYEYLAKRVLEETLPDRYGILGLADKPDLTSKCGNSVEVTRCMSTEEGTVNDLARKVLNHTVDDNSPELKKTINTIERKGYKLLEYHGVYVAYGPVEAIWSTPNGLINSTCSKIKKLDTYGGRTDLFIYASLLGDNEEIDVLNEYFDWCKKQFQQRKNKYHHIYIFDFESICDCDFDSLEMKTIYLKKNLVYRIVHEARKKFSYE